MADRPSRDDMLDVIGEIFCAVPEFDWRKVTEHMSQPARRWFADAVDEYFDEPADGDLKEPVKADRWWDDPPAAPTRTVTVLTCACGRRLSPNEGERVKITMLRGEQTPWQCMGHEIVPAGGVGRG